MVEPFSVLPAHFPLPDGRGGMNSACGRSPAAADWLPLEAEKQGCGPFRGRDFPDAGKVTKGAPSSSLGSWLRFAPRGKAPIFACSSSSVRSGRFARRIVKERYRKVPLDPSSRPRGADCPPLDPPAYVTWYRCSVENSRPRSPEGGSNGGNRRAVSPLAVGDGSQRKPPRNRFPLAVSFAAFFGGKESGPPEAA